MLLKISAFIGKQAVYCQIKVLPLDILIDIEYGKTMYKFLKGILPSVFDTYFAKPSHPYRTRFSSQNNLDVLRIESALDKSRLRYIGPKIWLNIQPNIREASSLKVFINSYRNHLIGHYEPWSIHFFIRTTLSLYTSVFVHQIIS